MRHATLDAAMPCPIARTLDIVGEWWSLLIVRDALVGAKRFDEFARSGISESTLATRLKRLTKAGILKRKLYQRSPDRYEYTLTEKGRELGAVILALRGWGLRWTKGAPNTAIIHEGCGGELGISVSCQKCGEEPGAVSRVPTHSRS
jgi:DNA-binding HxlR family transcriptional regulator